MSGLRPPWRGVPPGDPQRPLEPGPVGWSRWQATGVAGATGPQVDPAAQRSIVLEAPPPLQRQVSQSRRPCCWVAVTQVPTPLFSEGGCWPEEAGSVEAERGGGRMNHPLQAGGPGGTACRHVSLASSLLSEPFRKAASPAVASAWTLQPRSLPSVSYDSSGLRNTEKGQPLVRLFRA